jgi:hyperosmotically inducible protein
MKSPLAATAFLFAASLGLAACSNNHNPNPAADQQQASPAATSPGNPGAADSNQPVSDTWITTKVKAELATTQGVQSTDISVNTVNGVVTLTGVLDSDVAVDKAVAAARSVEGVKQVDSSGLKVK